MDELIKENKMKKFCNQIDKALYDDKYDLDKIDVIISINHIYPELFEEFDYDFKRLYNNISDLKKDISKGNVYKIHQEGSLKEDGYEKGYLFLYESSCVLEHIHIHEKEYYKVLCGDYSSVDKTCCQVLSSHCINPTKENTIVRTYKYIPEQPKID